jgi:hypothetical protein
MPGGLSAPITDPALLSRIEGYREMVETYTGLSFIIFEPIYYRKQLVAGYLYRAKVRVADEEYIYITIHRPLPGQGDEYVTEVQM